MTVARRVAMSTLVFVLCVSLGGASFAADKCKSVNAILGNVTYPDSSECVFQGVQYDFCIAATISGTLNGTDVYYGNIEEGTFSDGSCWTWYHAFEVITTKKGEIWGPTYGVFNGPTFGGSSVDTKGGTGQYEGAYGQIFYFPHLPLLALPFPDAIENMELKGMVCTPS